MFRSLIIILLLCALIVVNGCSKQVLVPYNKIEENNWVTVTLYSGHSIQGTVIQAEPHLLTIQSKDRRLFIEASKIQKVTRIPSMYDDFGNAISEEEIAEVKTGKNATVFGIGGGLLSLGVSFFSGSMLAQTSEDGGTVLAATTGAGGIIGTILFVQAGKRQDRREAVQKIRQERKSKQIIKTTKKQSIDDIRKEMNQEKKKQEELRREREKLLRELEETKQ